MMTEVKHSQFVVSLYFKDDTITCPYTLLQSRNEISIKIELSNKTANFPIIAYYCYNCGNSKTKTHINVYTTYS